MYHIDTIFKRWNLRKIGVFCFSLAKSDLTVSGTIAGWGFLYMKKIIRTEKVNTDENVLYIIGWILLLFLLVLGTAYGLWPELFRHLPPCLLHKLTGFYCPGCGGTRAVLALLRGKPVVSLVYHPFVLYTVCIGGWFMISQTVERLSKGRFAIGMKYRDWYLWAALVLVCVNFLVKNILLLWGMDVLKMLESL